MTDRFITQWLHPTECPTVDAVYRVIGGRQSRNVYNSYRYVASPITVEARETEPTIVVITVTNWSIMASSQLGGSASETNACCGTAHRGCAVWVIPGTPHFARARIARCVRSFMVHSTFPWLRRTRVGRDLGLGYTLHLYRPSRSTNATGDRGIKVDESPLGPTIIRQTTIPPTTR